jgi:hypothetical protein
MEDSGRAVVEDTVGRQASTIFVNGNRKKIGILARPFIELMANIGYGKAPYALL